MEASRADLEEIRDAFLFFDSDGSGGIDRKEMQQAMKVLGCILTRQEAAALIRKYDQDESGTVDLTEFVSLVREQRQAQRAGQKGSLMLQAALQHDRNQISHISDLQLARQRRQGLDQQAQCHTEAVRRERELQEDRERADEEWRRRKRALRRRAVKPSKASVEHRHSWQQAVRARLPHDEQAFKQEELQASLRDDVIRQQASVEARIHKIEAALCKQHSMAQQRTKEKNDMLRFEAMSKRRAEAEALVRRAENLQDETSRRHGRACRMLDGEVHDMGANRMRNFGRR